MKIDKESIKDFIATTILISSLCGFVVFLADIGITPIKPMELDICLESYFLGCASSFTYSIFLKLIFDLIINCKSKRILFEKGQNCLMWIEYFVLIFAVSCFVFITIVYFQGESINEQLRNFGFTYQLNIDAFKINHVDKVPFSIGLFLGGLLDKYNDHIHNTINRNKLIIKEYKIDYK